MTGKNKFTLLELLIVIAVIAILASLLLPALGKAVESARKASCQGNLKQIGASLALYASDQDGYIPAIYATSKDGTPWELWSGRLGGYLRTIRVFLCPSDTITKTVYGKVSLFSELPDRAGPFNGGNLAHLSYAMNQQKTASTNRQTVPLKLSRYHNSRGIAADSEPFAYPSNNAFRMCLKPIREENESKTSCLGIFHGGGANYLMTDGCVRFGHKDYLRTNPNLLWNLEP